MEALFHLGKNIFFTVLDIKIGFHQISLVESDIWCDSTPKNPKITFLSYRNFRLLPPFPKGLRKTHQTLNNTFNIGADTMLFAIASKYNGKWQTWIISDTIGMQVVNFKCLCSTFPNYHFFTLADFILHIGQKVKYLYKIIRTYAFCVLNCHFFLIQWYVLF